MADHHSSHNDYVHGEMDINQHRHSFELFVSLTKWCSYHLAVVGWLLLKKKPDAH